MAIQTPPNNTLTIVEKVEPLLRELALLLRAELASNPLGLENALLFVEGLRSCVLIASATPAPLPAEPPALWLKRSNRKEAPIDFISREYAPWLGKGLSRPHIRQLDKSLYLALYKWLSGGGKLPDDFELPTLSEVGDRKLQLMEGLLLVTEPMFREIWNLREVSRRRQNKQKRRQEQAACLQRPRT